MTITLGVGDIAILIVSLAFLILVAVSIPTLLQLRKTIKAMGDLAGESKTAVENVNEIVKKATGEVKEFEELGRRTREVGFKIVDLLENVLDTIRSPLITLVGLLVGVEFGVRKFIKRERKQKEDEKGGA